MTDEAFSFLLMMEQMRLDRRRLEKLFIGGIQTMLVEKVVDLLITIRGFSFAGSCMNRKRRPISGKLKVFERRCNYLIYK